MQVGTVIENKLWGTSFKAVIRCQEYINPGALWPVKLACCHSIDKLDLYFHKNNIDFLWKIHIPVVVQELKLWLVGPSTIYIAYLIKHPNLLLWNVLGECEVSLLYIEKKLRNYKIARHLTLLLWKKQTNCVSCATFVMICVAEIYWMLPVTTTWCLRDDHCYRRSRPGHDVVPIYLVLSTL